MATFDAKRVTPLEWAGIGAGALAFIVSFFSWYSVTAEGLGISRSEGITAWDAGFLAWFSMLLLLAAGAVVALPHFGTEVPNRALIWLGCAALSVVFIILRWVTYDGGSTDLGGFGKVSAGAGFGLFVGLVLAVVSGAAAFLNYRASSSRSHA